MKKLILLATLMSVITCTYAEEPPTAAAILKKVQQNLPNTTPLNVNKVTPEESNTNLLKITITANTAATNFIPIKEAIGYLDNPHPADPKKAIAVSNLTVYSLLMAEMVTNLNGQRDAATQHALKIMATGFVPTKEDYLRVLQFLPKKPCGSDYLMTPQFAGYIYLLNTLKSAKQTAVLTAAIQALEAQKQYSAMFARINELYVATH